jgi:hypothetical protein
LAASRVLGTRGCYGLLQLEYKIKEGPGVLTEVWSGRGVTQRHRRRDPAAGRGQSFAVRALQGSSERLDPSGCLAVLLRRCYGGKGRPRTTSGEQLLESAITCGDGIRGNSGAGVARSRGSVLGGFVDSEVKLPCRLGGGGVVWSGMAAAVGCPAPAEARQGDALGFGRLRQ